MELGPPPQPGEPTDELWRYVAELYKYVRALGNVRVVYQTPYPSQGKNAVTDTENVISLT